VTKNAVEIPVSNSFKFSSQADWLKLVGHFRLLEHMEKCQPVDEQPVDKVVSGFIKSVHKNGTATLELVILTERDECTGESLKPHNCSHGMVLAGISLQPAQLPRSNSSRNFGPHASKRPTTYVYPETITVHGFFKDFKDYPRVEDEKVIVLSVEPQMPSPRKGPNHALQLFGNHGGNFSEVEIVSTLCSDSLRVSIPSDTDGNPVKGSLERLVDACAFKFKLDRSTVILRYIDPSNLEFKLLDDHNALCSTLYDRAPVAPLDVESARDPSEQFARGMQVPRPTTPDASRSRYTDEVDVSSPKALPRSASTESAALTTQPLSPTMKKAPAKVLVFGNPMACLREPDIMELLEPLCDCCREDIDSYIIEAGRFADPERELVAFFAEPKGTKPLNVVREWRSLDFNISSKEVIPAARFPKDVEDCLRAKPVKWGSRLSAPQYSPRWIQFSGHGRQIPTKDGISSDSECPLVFEQDYKPDKFDKKPSAQDFVNILKLCVRLEGVYLNACYSAEYAEYINKCLPMVATIGWRLKTNDTEAYAFSRKLYKELGTAIGRPFEEAFHCALVEYRKFWTETDGVKALDGIRKYRKDPTANFTEPVMFPRRDDDDSELSSPPQSQELPLAAEAPGCPVHTPDGELPESTRPLPAVGEATGGNTVKRSGVLETKALEAAGYGVTSIAGVSEGASLEPVQRTQKSVCTKGISAGQAVHPAPLFQTYTQTNDGSDDFFVVDETSAPNTGMTKQISFPAFQVARPAPLVDAPKQLPNPAFAGAPLGSLSGLGNLDNDKDSPPEEPTSIPLAAPALPRANSGIFAAISKSQSSSSSSREKNM
jgi:hypothetical protein